MVNAAVTTTMADRLEELGHISPSRLRLSPPPGTATIDDLTLANTHSKPLCELIDQSLVEKAVGFEASVVAAAILSILHKFVSSRRLGIVSGADGMFELLPGTVRAPDIAFISTERLPGGRFPRTAFPAIAPDLVVEVLSPGNTKAEMSRKRVEYFHSGTRLVWMVDCTDRSVAVYTSPSAVRVFGEEDMIDGGDVLPEFSQAVADFFVDLDMGHQ
jgi:Uma2 family endonuclease